LSIELFNEDCIETMKRIPDGSIDLMLTDIPYGTTQNNWDVLPNLPEIWFEWERILKPNGAWLFTATNPIAANLINSRAGFFKYDWVWNKVNKFSGHLNKDRQPMRITEMILVFYRMQPIYNPQMRKGKPYVAKSKGGKSNNYGKQVNVTTVSNGDLYPINLLNIKGDRRGDEGRVHPTQKPVDLFRYLIRTYSNKGETVYDGYLGSGTTAIACIKEKRNFIGAELNKEYYDLAQKRIDNELGQPVLF